MRAKKWIGIVAAGSLFAGCSTVNDMVTWHKAKAEEVAQFVSQVKPWRGDPAPVYRIGCYYQEQGLHRKAIEAFQKVLSYDSN